MLFLVKFPDDILHDNLPGQLWFGAEVSHSDERGHPLIAYIHISLLLTNDVRYHD